MMFMACSLETLETFSVMPGLVPGIHVFFSPMKKDVDGRDQPGHDAAKIDYTRVISNCAFWPVP
jgi:hypothetical protein